MTKEMKYYQNQIYALTKKIKLKNQIFINMKPINSFKIKNKFLRNNLKAPDFRIKTLTSPKKPNQEKYQI